MHVGYLLKAEETTWSSQFANGVKVDLRGSLIVHFAIVQGPGGQQALKIESLQFDSRGHEEWIARDAVVSEQIERVLEGLASGKEGQAVKKEVAAAAGGKKGAELRGRRKSTVVEDSKAVENAPVLEKERIILENHIMPASPVGSFGITEMGMRCLEVCFLSLSRLKSW